MPVVEGLSVVAIVLVVLAIVTIMMAVRQVPQGYNYTVERFGRYYKTLSPGLGWVLPFIDRVGRRVNVMEQVLDVPSQEVITKDNASIRVDGVAFFQILDGARASYQVANLEKALINLIVTNVRSVMGSMDLDQLLSHRDEINTKLLLVVDAALEPWGVKANRIEIKDIVPPQDLAEAMGRQMKAERVKRAAVLEAEGQRQAEVLRAEGHKQAVMLEAEGRREASFRDAEARERAAQAEATAMGVVSEAIGRGDLAALNYFVAEKYVHALDALARAPNQKVIIVPMEMSALVGTLGGIAEIAKSALGDNRSPENAAQRRPTTPRTPAPSNPVTNADGSPWTPR